MASPAPGYAINGVVGWSHTFLASAPTKVTPAAPAFDDPEGTANDKFTIPASQLGVRYVYAGNVIAPGTYPVDPASPTVVVDAVATAGYQLVGTSSWTHTFTGNVTPPPPPPPPPSTPDVVAGTPTISGDALVGLVLTAGAGTWTPSDVTLAYQWLRDGSLISGATEATYTAVTGDIGKKLAVRITGTKSGYDSATATSAPTATVLGVLSPGEPTVTGKAIVGRTLTAEPGDWAPDGVTFAYQWLRDGTPIEGATLAKYRAVPEDLGHRLAVRVTGSKPDHVNSDVTSTATDTVLGVLTSARPTVSGQRRVGHTLHAHPGKWGPAGVALSYQWLRNGKLIRGATGHSYHLRKADRGARIQVVVTGSKPVYLPVSRTSAGGGKVKPAR
jgi:hypothetical protein